MSWRTVIISNTCKIDYSMGYMVVRSVDKTAKIHLSEISMLIIETTSCSVTASLMNELIKKKVKVVFCDEKHSPAFELTAYYGSHDCSLKLKNQISWKDDIKQALWTVIVAEKIKNQSILLEKLQYEQYKMLCNYIEEIEFADKSNREGHAAKVYFNALFGKSFSRGSDNYINAALNYGYSLLLSAFNREVICSGYLTQLGLFHDNRFNQYNLSCDLMEPFRPYVDEAVTKMNPLKFEADEKLILTNLFNKEVYIDGRKNTLLNAIKIYCKSIFSAIEQGDTSLIKFTDFKYEL